MAEGLYQNIRESVEHAPQTVLLLVGMWVVFGVRLILEAVAPGSGDQLFLLRPSNLTAIWTWALSVFAHGSLLHITVNSYVLYSFGRVTERMVGRWFAVAFVVVGAVSGAAQVVVGEFLASSPPVLGSSAGIAMCIGITSAVMPRLKLNLLFAIPLEQWIFMLIFLVGSSAVVLFVGPGAFGLAHVAHIVGAVLGVAIGIGLDGGAAKDRVREMFATGMADP